MGLGPLIGANMLNQSIDEKLQILGLRVRALDLGMRYLNLIYKAEYEHVRGLGEKLAFMHKSQAKYNFVDRLSYGPLLFVGEGNLSFAHDLAQRAVCSHSIVASTYEEYGQLSDVGKVNAQNLQGMGVQVLHGVDATQLQHHFTAASFATIIFQFPNAGSREPVDGHNPNFILVRAFLFSAPSILTAEGIVLITTVDNDYYNNVFKFEELAHFTHFLQPIRYNFDPNDYPDYEHTMTHIEGSALDVHHKFATWEFKLCNRRAYS